jgi:23S rRNA pseudouridine2605 synthase
LTSEQLQATRALRWRQNSEPVLTQEDAQSWLQQAGLCLFLPRRAQLPAPAPSFVEASLGEPNPTPARAAVENSLRLAARLIGTNAVVPLNLFGSPTDHPDFLVTADTLSFVYALRGDRDWKHAPGSAGSNRVSPLVLEVWKLLEQKETLSAAEIQSSLGRELTEAAVVRALHELWGSLRVIPLYQDDGQATLWATLQSRHPKALTAAINMSQVTALSILASLYFTSAVAASAEEAEVFLSPLASRAKVREVIRGLTATRQLSMTSLDRETLLYVEGSLPEFEEPLPGPAPTAETRRVPRKPFVPAAERPTSGSSMRPASTSSKPVPAWKRPGREKTANDLPVRPARKSAAPARGTGESRSAGPRPAASGGFARRERPPARPPWKDKGKPGFAKSAAAKDPKARWPREGRTPGTDQPPFSPRPAATGRSGLDRSLSGAGGTRPPHRTGQGSFPKRGEFKPVQAKGDFRSKNEAGSGFQSRPPRSAADTGRRPPRREASFSKPRSDFKDFKPRKAGTSGKFGSRPAGPGFPRPERRTDERPVPVRRETGEFKPRGDDRDRRRSAGPPKTFGGKPWDRKSGDRSRGGFKPSRDPDSRPRGGDRPDRAGARTEDRRPSAVGGSRPERRFSGPRGPKAFGSRPDREREKPSLDGSAGSGRPFQGSGGTTKPARPGGFRKSGGFGKRSDKPSGGSAAGRPPFRSSPRSSSRPKSGPKRRPQ